MLFREPEGRWTAIIGLQPSPGSRLDLPAVAGAIAGAKVPSAVLIDVKAEIDNLYSGYFERALAASALGLVVIVALLFAALRSPARVLRVMAPLLAGVLVVAAWHAASGTQMSLLHLVGLLLVIAIGSNYALFDRIPFVELSKRDLRQAQSNGCSLHFARQLHRGRELRAGALLIPVLSAIGPPWPCAFITPRLRRDAVRRWDTISAGKIQHADTDDTAHDRHPAPSSRCSGPSEPRISCAPVSRAARAPVSMPSSSWRKRRRGSPTAPWCSAFAIPWWPRAQARGKSRIWFTGISLRLAALSMPRATTDVAASC
jgi:hypothetical protein